MMFYSVGRQASGSAKLLPIQASGSFVLHRQIMLKYHDKWLESARKEKEAEKISCKSHAVPGCNMPFVEIGIRVMVSRDCDD